MPTYQYACTECGHRFEQVQSFTDDSLTVCPVCAGRLRKVFNAVGVVFKGSGFYRNDSREAPKSGASTGSSESGDKSGSGEKSGSDEKSKKSGSADKPAAASGSGEKSGSKVGASSGSSDSKSSTGSKSSGSAA